MKIARGDKQLSLLDVRPFYKTGTNALNRNAYGYTAQEIVCAAMCLTPIRINGQYSVCLDAERDDCFYEIKSVRQKNKIVVYKWRLEKELTVPHPIYYVLLGHNVRKASCTDLISFFASRPLELILAPLATVQSLTKLVPIRQLIEKTEANKRNGYNRPGYLEGYYNIDYALFKERSEYCGLRKFWLYGTEIVIQLRRIV